MLASRSATNTCEKGDERGAESAPEVQGNNLHTAGPPLRELFGVTVGLKRREGNHKTPRRLGGPADYNLQPCRLGLEVEKHPC